MVERHRRVAGRLGLVVVVVAALAACGPTAADPEWNGGAPSVAPVRVPPESAVVAHASGPGGAHWALVISREGLHLHRLTSAGTPDPTFATATGGRLLIHDGAYTGGIFLGPVMSADVLPTPDGGAYLVKRHTDRPFEYDDSGGTTIQKVTAAGTVDATFHAAPSATTEQRVGALDASGRVLVAGAELTRLTATGQPDPTFGGDGSVPLPADLQGTLTVVGDEPVIAGSAKVARLAADGTTLWATGVPAGPGSASIASLVAGPGGTVVAGTWVDPASRGVRVHRLTAAGALDTSFDGDGSRDTTVPWPAPTAAEVDEIAVDAAGGVILPFRIPGTESSEGRILRLAPNGTWDGGWGASGGVRLDGTPQARPAGRLLPPPSRWSGYLTAVVLQGAVVASGSGIVVATRLTGSPDGELVRYTATGQVDASFSGDGIARFDALTTADSSVADTALVSGPAGSTTAQPVVALVGSAKATHLVRYGADGEIDTSWGTDGRSAPLTSGAVEVEPLPGGSFLVASISGTPQQIVLTLVDGADGHTTPWGELQLIGRADIPADAVRVRAVPGGGVVVAAGRVDGTIQGFRLDAQGVLKAQQPIGVLDRPSFDIAVNAYSVVVAALWCPGPTGTPCRPMLRSVNTSNLLPRENFAESSYVIFEDPAQGWDAITRLLWTGSTLTVVGTTSAPGVAATTRIARRVASTGAPTPGFGTGGVVDTGAPPSSDAMVDTQGRTLLVSARQQAPAVRRFTKPGAPDTTFGPGGVAALPAFAHLSTGELDAGGRIVVGGGVDRSAAVLRLTPA